MGFGEQLGFEMIGINRHFAGGDFFVGCAVKAEFTHAEALFRANRRTKGAASHRAMCVEVTGSGLRIERGTRFVIGEVFEPALCAWSLVEDAGLAIAGEVVGNSLEGFAGSLANPSRASRIGNVEFREALAQSGGVELVDGEDADAALRAAGATDEPMSGALCGVGES